MGEGYRRIIQDHDSEVSVARQRELEEAERQRADVARSQAAVDAWFGTVFRPELDAANDAIRDLKASILITNSQQFGGKARHRLEFRRQGRMSPPYMLIIGDGEFSMVQYALASNKRGSLGTSCSPPEANEHSDVAHFRRLGMGVDDGCIPQIIEAMITESLRMLQ